LAKREIIANAFVFTHNVLGFSFVKKDNPHAKVIKIMEITAIFLIFLLFYRNIFVILKQKYKVMNYIFTKQEVRVLKHLADGQQHDEAPAGLSDAQFYVALKSLKANDFVYADFAEGGKVVSSKIKIKGRAALDDLKNLEEAMLNHILNQKGLTKYSYAVLVHFKNKGEQKNIFEGEKTNKEFGAILKSLLKKHLLCYHTSDRITFVTDEGLQLLEDIDYLWDKERTDWANGQTKNLVSTGLVSANIHIDPKRRREMMKFIVTTSNHGFYKDENGKPYKLEDVMNAYALFLGDDKLKEYSSLVNESGELEDKGLIDELQPIFYGSVPDVISFVEKIKTINNNPEIVRVAADYVNKGIISNMSCKSALWKVLNKYDIYNPTLNTWCKCIANYMK